MNRYHIKLTVNNITALILKHNESKTIRSPNDCTYRPLNSSRTSKQLQPENRHVPGQQGER